MTSKDTGWFLDRLPIGLPIRDAALVMAGITRRVFELTNSGPASSFSDLTGEVPREVDALLCDLDASLCTPDLLGLAWEQLLADGDRRVQGAHFTPRSAADRVVRSAFDALGGVAVEPGLRLDLMDIGRVWDPAAGGGAFLLAAARMLESVTGRDRSDIVASMYASDIDAVALRVCDASLSLWAGGTARPVTACGDALVDLPSNWPTTFSIVVGNPPFLGQLTTDTARTQVDSSRLKAEYGALAAGYVDQAALFVELGLRRLTPGGALAMILPQSFLGSIDTAAVRASAANRARLDSIWFDDHGVFDASVDVMAIAMVCSESSAAGSTRVLLGDGEPLTVPTPSPASWAPLLAAAQGVPLVSRPTGQRVLSDVASVTAGFRQHFYGIGEAVREDDDGSDTAGTDTAGTAPLVTSGAIDPLANLWGRRAVKFAGSTWRAPRLVLDAIDDPSVREWFQSRLVPKVLLASQTRVLEAVVDPQGTLAPSVPTISVEPHDPALVWHLAALLSAPTTSALLIADAAGTGLSSAAIRVRAKAISALALPEDSTAWDRGAVAAQRAHEAWERGDERGHLEGLRATGSAMIDAFEDGADVFTWWESRLPKRTNS